MEVDIVHFYELKWNFGRALENDDVNEVRDDTAGVMSSTKIKGGTCKFT